MSQSEPTIYRVQISAPGQFYGNARRRAGIEVPKDGGYVGELTRDQLKAVKADQHLVVTQVADDDDSLAPAAQAEAEKIVQTAKDEAAVIRDAATDAATASVEQAKQEAERIVAEANSQAEEIVAKANANAEEKAKAKSGTNAK